MSTKVRIEQPTTVYKFKDSTRVPQGVTVEGVMEERQRIFDKYGRATASESADAILADPESFPHLRAWAPTDAETALRLCIEQGVRSAFKSVVKVDIVQAPRARPREVEIRLFHAVPTPAIAELSYESINVIREDQEQRTFLIHQLRTDARAFSERLETVLGELELVTQALF